MKFACNWCGVEGHSRKGPWKPGAPLYCSQKCSGLARRKHKPAAQKKKEKQLYDIKYREKNRVLLKGKKAAYFQRTYDPVKAAVYRKKNMARHVVYCQRPEYVKWKKNYDRRYRAKKNFGEYWECHLITQDIEGEIMSRASHYEIRLETGTLNKSTKRKRSYERLISNKLEAGSLGNLERHQRR